MCPIIIYNFLPVHCVDYVENQSVSKICQDSGFDTDDIRTFVSGQQTLEQISYVTFVGQCSGNLDNGETRECTVENYIVSLEEIPTNGDGLVFFLQKWTTQYNNTIN